MTKHECAIVMAYTGVVTLRGNDMHYFYEYAKQLMHRPIFTHEIPKLSDEIQRRAKDDFLRLCAEAT